VVLPNTREIGNISDFRQITRRKRYKMDIISTKGEVVCDPLNVDIADELNDA